MKKRSRLSISNKELFTRIGDLLLNYDYKPQGDLMLSYAPYFENPDPLTAQDDAQHILGLFSGWGGLSDIVLANEDGPSTEDNRLFDELRSELYARMLEMSKDTVKRWDS